MRTAILLFSTLLIAVAALWGVAQLPLATAAPVLSATPTSQVIVFSANGQPSLMYSDEYGVFQLYLSTNIDAPLTDHANHTRHPRWSPDRTQIAYTTVAVGETSPLLIATSLGESAVEVMDADGGNPRRLTAGQGEYAPAWSPDGAQIAYASLADEAVYVTNADGSGTPRLVRAGLFATSLDFAPDGERLLVTVREDNATRRVYLLSLDGSTLQPLLPGVTVWDAVWSPDGAQIAFATTDGILLSDDEGATARPLPLTGGLEYMLQDGFSIDALAWSPDGTRLACVLYSARLRVAISTPVPIERVGPQLAVVDVATGEIRVLTYGFTNADPDW